MQYLLVALALAHHILAGYVRIHLEEARHSAEAGIIKYARFKASSIPPKPELGNVLSRPSIAIDVRVVDHYFEHATEIGIVNYRKE